MLLTVIMALASERTAAAQADELDAGGFRAAWTPAPPCGFDKTLEIPA